MKFGFSKRTCGFSTAHSFGWCVSPSPLLVAGQARRGWVITQPIIHLHRRPGDLCVSKKNVLYFQEDVRIAVASGQWFPGLPGTLQIREEECNFCNTKPGILKVDRTYRGFS